MRRLTIFVFDDEYAILREAARRRNLGPHHYANLFFAKSLGAKIPKGDLAAYLDERIQAMQQEGYKAEELGKGTRRVDRIARVMAKKNRPMTASEIAKELGLSKSGVTSVLNSYSPFFDRANPERKAYEPVLWRLTRKLKD